MKDNKVFIPFVLSSYESNSIRSRIRILVVMKQRHQKHYILVSLILSCHQGGVLIIEVIRTGQK